MFLYAASHPLFDPSFSAAAFLAHTKTGGKIVVVDCHRPSGWHPLGSLMRLVFRFLEPFAMDLWRHSIASFLPQHIKPAKVSKSTYFGGLHQMVVITR